MNDNRFAFQTDNASLAEATIRLPDPDEAHTFPVHEHD